MNVVIIGSGTSAITVAKTFLEYNHKVHLIDAGNLEHIVDYKKKTKFLPNLKRSPKFQNRLLGDSLKKFKKKYNIKTKNFYLVSALISGGLSNFWGAGLEIPSLNYLKKYSFGKLILDKMPLAPFVLFIGEFVDSTNIDQIMVPVNTNRG